MRGANQLILGLTGLIGSGKSTVAQLFADLGARIIDTDTLAQQLTLANGAAIESLRDKFGARCLDAQGALDRVWMREQVFGNSEHRKELERILHPLIFAQVQAELILSTSALYTIVMVPLLFRSHNYLAITQRNIFVDCEYPQLIRRIKLRSGLNQAQIDAILAQQVERKQQLKLADDIITNHGDLEALLPQVITLHNKYTKTASLF